MLRAPRWTYGVLTTAYLFILTGAEIGSSRSTSVRGMKMGAASSGSSHQAKKRQSLPNDQEVTFPDLEPTFEELDAVVKQFGKEARTSSISGFPEQVDFYARVATHPSVRTVCETGFNAGYSTSVWLATNPLLKVINFDLPVMEYGASCAEFLQNKFPDRLEVHWGSSAKLVPEFVATHSDKDVYNGPMCDLVHIDGDHSFEGAQSDFLNMFPMMDCSTFILMDDVLDDDMNGPTKLWTALKSQGVVVELDNFYTSSVQMQHIRKANGPKGFVFGRLKCAQTKPVTLKAA